MRRKEPPWYFLFSKYKMFPSVQYSDPYKRIITTSNYNGRVNLLEPEDPNAKFRMFEKVNAKNRSSNYFDALNGSLEWNNLAESYFSAENMDRIQEHLRVAIYDKSQGSINIPRQNVDTLKAIMRTMYLQYAEHYPTDIPKQVEYLNHRVLDFIAPRVYSEALGYQKYLLDQSTLVMPMERPVASDRAWKQLEYKKWT